MWGVQGDRVKEQQELSARRVEPYDWVKLGVLGAGGLAFSKGRVSLGLMVAAMAVLLGVLTRFRGKPSVYVEGTTIYVTRRKEVVQIPAASIREVKQTGLTQTRITLVLDESVNFGTEFTFTPKNAWHSIVGNALGTHPVTNEIRRLAGLAKSANVPS